LKKPREEVRILLVGDRNVGKTSLILSLVSEEFPIDVPARAEEITIPGDLTPEKVPTCIVDYSSSEQTDPMLETELEKADVVCIVYAVDDEDSLESVAEHWLPLLRVTLGQEHTTPVILVGNKVDQVDYTTMDSVMPIMNDYEEIETCVECSARNLKNISEMFYFAQKAVLHPSAPLWNYQDKDLTGNCKLALGRIFKICDIDNDGILSDQELARFQRRCFNMDLEPGTLESLKAVVLKSCPGGIQSEGLTSKGFLVLNSLFIQRGRHETTWTILRKFGYADDLAIQPDQLIRPLTVEPGSTVELTQSGVEFLTLLFASHDLDLDQALSPGELVALFSVCSTMPWGPGVYHQVATNKRGWLGLAAYLARWHLMAFEDHELCAHLLAQLGYDYHATGSAGNRTPPLSVTREAKSSEGSKQTNKQTYSCLVVGPKDAGKTTFCQRLVGRNLVSSQVEIPVEERPRSVIHSVVVYGQQKHLVLLDTDIQAASSCLTASETGCDCVCLVYDASNPRSFEYCARIYLRYFSNSGQVPVLLVANKADKGVVRQDYILQPEAFCNKHRLPPPQKTSVHQGLSKDIFLKLATMAAFPKFEAAWMLFYRGRHFNKLGLAGEQYSLLRISLGLALLTFGSYVAHRYWSRR